MLSWKTVLSAFETALVSGLSTFAASIEITGTPTVKGVVAAATASGIGALYQFTKALGAAQSSTTTPTTTTTTVTPKPVVPPVPPVPPS